MKDSLKAVGLVFFSMCLSIFYGLCINGVSYIFFGEPEFPEPDKE